MYYLSGQIKLGYLLNSEVVDRLTQQQLIRDEIDTDFTEGLVEYCTTLLLLLHQILKKFLQMAKHTHHFMRDDIQIRNYFLLNTGKDNVRDSLNHHFKGKNYKWMGGMLTQDKFILNPRISRSTVVNKVSNLTLFLANICQQYV
ncbi:hypothetical protein TTHERM_01122830 (macronuclear) [Tetrahymena thermophila SB210]|uniref:Uncharacterized protein n=1 Tax=Tetrahymena thermophila (strain SB210) TaxID=312017 RepID=Q23S09_TETTS|nr:hypothetical protein TTHERM_01122830 [Tetrahymena thermophila SB210]EAR99338.3 hypothetical protein TTHERM_01122830 [Tetrahymena thermophila SB210]|eukprot:XP_001019583.3 hypothetical protein TTHERM_01122830 [Tetrahymena thermophila SB210]